MEFVITTDSLIKLAAFLSAIGALGGIIFWCFKFVERNRKQDMELSAMRKEMTLIFYGVTACLKAFKEQGCDGPVTTALEKLESYVNEMAHRDEF